MDEGETREMSFVLPWTNPEIPGLEPQTFHAQVLLSLSGFFGGATSIPGVGGWRSSNNADGTANVMREEIILYNVAVPNSQADNVEAYALTYARMLKQDVLYLRRWDGTVAFIPVEERSKLQ